MTTSGAPGEVVFRQPGRVLGAVAMALLLGIYTLQFMSHRGPGREAGFRVLLAVLVPLLLVSAVIRWRAQVTVDDTGVRSRPQMFRRRRRLAWSDVDHFELRGYWRGLGARTVDGRWVPLLMTGYYGEAAIGIWEQLEQIREQRQRGFVLPDGLGP